MQREQLIILKNYRVYDYYGVSSAWLLTKLCFKVPFSSPNPKQTHTFKIASKYKHFNEL